MDDILLTRRLLDDGYDRGELRRLARAGKLVRVRRGAWVRSAAGSIERSVEEIHQMLIAAVTAQAGPGAVVSHSSAAVLHGLWVWPSALEQVHLTRDRSTGSRRSPDLEVHSATLPPGQVTVIGDLQVTSLARTVADLGRTLTFERAVAAGDRAAAQGLDFGDLAAVLQTMERWPGVCQARRVANFIDGRSESVGESVSRVRLGEEGLPGPVPQREIYDQAGKLIARVDFCWDKQRTVGEFDGKLKYELLKPGQRSADVLFAEKLREDALRDAGWQVARWVWADLYRPGVLRDRVLRAFARAR